MIRVFPRKTNLTPDDDKVYFTGPPMNRLEDQEVHVSVTFIEDKPRAEKLAELWDIAGYNVKIGGPAYDDRGGDFVPGRYVKHGAVITSRGCDNNCWFCKVHEREGSIRELPITNGWNVLDSNLLQCSEDHIRKVFQMLKEYKRITKEAILFTGGLEAKILKPWHCELLADLKPKRMYFAYDKPKDWKQLKKAKKKLKKAGVTISHNIIYTYVLIGYPKDTVASASKRLKRVKALGFTPFAMMYQDGKNKNNDPKWLKLRSAWIRPAKIHRKRRKPEKDLFTCQ